MKSLGFRSWGKSGGGRGGRADLLIPPSLIGKTPKVWGLLLKSRGTSFEGLAVVAILLEFSGDMRYGKSSSQENPNRNSAQIAAEVMFASDRTCCICRSAGRKTEIHHIDEDPSNNDFNNLAVVCKDCQSDGPYQACFRSKPDFRDGKLYTTVLGGLSSKENSSAMTLTNSI